MSNNKQSSVEWLTEQVLHLDWQFLTQEKKRQICKQAKAMHKKEIMTTYKDGRLCIKPLEISLEDEYYNSTFGGNNEQQ